MSPVTRTPFRPPDKLPKPPVAPSSGDLSSPFGLRAHRENEVGSRQGARPRSRAGGCLQGGAALAAASPRLPIPKEDTPPSARPLPTLAWYRLPAPPSPTASQAASERGERSGMGLEGGGSGHGVGADFFVASRERCSRSAAVLGGARRRTTETDPRGCAPASLPRYPRRWLQVSAARCPGHGQTDPLTDRRTRRNRGATVHWAGWEGWWRCRVSSAGRSPATPGQAQDARRRSGPQVPRGGAVPRRRETQTRSTLTREWGLVERFCSDSPIYQVENNSVSPVDWYLKARVVWISFAFSVTAPTPLYCGRSIGRGRFVVVAGNLEDSLGRGQKNMETIPWCGLQE